MRDRVGVDGVVRVDDFLRPLVGGGRVYLTSICIWHDIVCERVGIPIYYSCSMYLAHRRCALQAGQAAAYGFVWSALAVDAEP